MELKPVESSMIQMIGYNEDAEELMIQFNTGKIYTYVGVPKEVWEKFIEAESVGSFFHKNIKGKYETLKSDIE